MIDPVHFESLLKFLDIQRKYWRMAVERSVFASVRAIHFLHKVRFWGLSDAGRPDLDPKNSNSGQDDRKDGTVIKRKSRGSRASQAPDS